MSKLQSGPCIVCGAKNYRLSMGGSAICPSCDVGRPNHREIRELREKYAALLSSHDEQGREIKDALNVLRAHLGSEHSLSSGVRNLAQAFISERNNAIDEATKQMEAESRAQEQGRENERLRGVIVELQLLLSKRDDSEARVRELEAERDLLSSKLDLALTRLANVEHAKSEGERVGNFSHEIALQQLREMEAERGSLRAQLEAAQGILRDWESGVIHGTR